MPCYHPSTVGVQRKSVFPGRRLSYMQVVPCGNCLGCRQEQARQWAVRMVHEAQTRRLSWFATLSYSDKHLPQWGELEPSHLRGFVDKLRLAYPLRSIAYYGCGEYGDTTFRPHYHVCLFGPEFLDRKPHPDKEKPGVWLSESLEYFWDNKGACELAPLTMGSASYTAGYIRKKLHGERESVFNVRTGHLLREPFSRQSLRPAIGKRWIERYWKDVYPRDFVVVDGVESKPPRYYDKWMDENHPEVMEEVRQKRFEEMEELPREKLVAAEVIHKDRVGLFQSRSAL